MRAGESGAAELPRLDVRRRGQLDLHDEAVRRSVEPRDFDDAALAPGDGMLRRLSDANLRGLADCDLPGARLVEPHLEPERDGVLEREERRTRRRHRAGIDVAFGDDAVEWRVEHRVGSWQSERPASPPLPRRVRRWRPPIAPLPLRVARRRRSGSPSPDRVPAASPSASR